MRKFLGRQFVVARTVEDKPQVVVRFRETGARLQHRSVGRDNRLDLVTLGLVPDQRSIVEQIHIPGSQLSGSIDYVAGRAVSLHREIGSGQALHHRNTDLILLQQSPGLLQCPQGLPLSYEQLNAEVLQLHILLIRGHAGLENRLHLFEPIEPPAQFQQQQAGTCLPGVGLKGLASLGKRLKMTSLTYSHCCQFVPHPGIGRFQPGHCGKLQLCCFPICILDRYLQLLTELLCTAGRRLRLRYRLSSANIGCSLRWRTLRTSFRSAFRTLFRGSSFHNLRLGLITLFLGRSRARLILGLGHSCASRQHEPHKCRCKEPNKTRIHIPPHSPTGK